MTVTLRRCELLSLSDLQVVRPSLNRRDAQRDGLTLPTKNLNGLEVIKLIPAEQTFEVLRGMNGKTKPTFPCIMMH